MLMRLEIRLQIPCKCQIIPFWALINRLPMSRVTYAVPFRTMSITVLHAFADNLSVGDTKFAAALLMIISGRPHLLSHKLLRTLARRLIFIDNY